MKEFFPSYYKNYYSEILRSNDDKKEKKKLPKLKNPKVRKRNPEKKDVQYFIPIKKGKSELFEKAITLCTLRNIPEEIWSTWFVAIDGTYKNRLIIPFYDDKGKIYFYQGRSLNEYMTTKYLSRAGDYNSIYNYYNVDKNVPVIILEGLIDSIFVENSIAITGVKIEDDRINDFENRRFLIDYDCVTQDTRKKVISLLIKGEYVFNWKKFIKKHKLPEREKWDVNDVCLYLKKDKFTYKELEPFFTNSIYDKVFFV